MCASQDCPVHDTEAVMASAIPAEDVPANGTEARSSASAPSPHAEPAQPPQSPQSPHMVAEPGWVRHAIAWHVYPLGAVGAPALCPPGDPNDPASEAAQAASAHRLRRLIPWLDHLVSLAANVLQLGPVFHSMSHGYDTVNYFRVDPRLGTNDDLEALIAAAHERGIRVLLDGVFNHTGLAYPDCAALAQTGPHSREASMYHLTWPLDEAGCPTWTPGTPPVDYRRFEGQDWLPELNHDSPTVEDLVDKVMTFWCERGVDGWRLDAAYAVDPAFWARVLPRIRERFPELYVYGEVIHGDYGAYIHASLPPIADAVPRPAPDASPSQPAGSAQSLRPAAHVGLNAVTQYELWQAIWHSLAERNFYELDWCLRRYDAMLCGAPMPGVTSDAPIEAGSRLGCVPWTFLGNHDTSRIASLTGRAALPHAVALLALLPGTPAVYYGDEEGWEAIKEERLGGDDAIRPALPVLPPASDDPSTTSYANRVRAHYQELLGLRRRLPWLHEARFTTLHLDNRLYALQLIPRTTPTTHPGEQTDEASSGVVLVLSLEEHEAWLPTHGAQRILAWGAGLGEPAQQATPPRAVRDGVVLAAGGWAVLTADPLP